VPWPFPLFATSPTTGARVSAARRGGCFEHSATDYARRAERVLCLRYLLGLFFLVSFIHSQLSRSRAQWCLDTRYRSFLIHEESLPRRHDRRCHDSKSLQGSVTLPFPRFRHSPWALLSPFHFPCRYSTLYSREHRKPRGRETSEAYRTAGVCEKFTKKKEKNKASDKAESAHTGRYH